MLNDCKHERGKILEKRQTVIRNFPYKLRNIITPRGALTVSVLKRSCALILNFTV
ncbi:MAG: hypothetical protein JWN60_2553 [Acidobacteria bacterium]|jgi:hypothetical protein|nr:hypothetical protein [Acidobacteriota bacterium]